MYSKLFSFIAVQGSHLNKVFQSWGCKQRMKNVQRYLCSSLKHWKNKKLFYSNCDEAANCLSKQSKSGYSSGDLVIWAFSQHQKIRRYDKNGFWHIICDVVCVKRSENFLYQSGCVNSNYSSLLYLWSWRKAMTSRNSMSPSRMRHC